MKKLVTMAAMALFISSAATIHALSDPLWQTTIPVNQSSPVIAVAPLSDVQQAVMDWTEAWAKDVQRNDALAHTKWSERTPDDVKYLDFGRFHKFDETFIRKAKEGLRFYARTFNWQYTGETPSYGYTAMQSLVNDLAITVERYGAPADERSAQELANAVLGILQQHVSTTEDDNLRVYMNQLVCFSAQESLARMNSY